MSSRCWYGVHFARLRDNREGVWATHVAYQPTPALPGTARAPRAVRGAGGKCVCGASVATGSPSGVLRESRLGLSPIHRKDALRNQSVGQQPIDHDNR